MEEEDQIKKGWYERWSIAYTLRTMADMVPRELQYISAIPILASLARILQLFWYLTKIIFFTMVISWFKQEYKQLGAKVVLFLITISIFIVAWWITARENKKDNTYKS